MPEALEEYNRKRNFERTGEPEGHPEAPEGGLRFVVQHHIARRDHFDFRLEWDGALLSWAVPKGPSFDPKDRRLAVRVEDHPLEYRYFEGTIPKGEYGGGAVMLWDEGFWEPQSDAAKGLKEGSLKLVLHGRRLRGKWALVHLKPKAGETGDNWLLLKEKDEYAATGPDISEFTTSIRTGRSMAEIEQGDIAKITKNPFTRTEVQLAKLASAVPEEDGWLYELKYDGYRIVAYLEGSTVRLVTRNDSDYTVRFHDVAASLLDWAGGRALVLDGEMVITDARGRSDFQALQSYLKNPGGKRLTYILFDLLALDGEDLRGRPLTQRKEQLESLLKDAPKNLRYSPHVQGNGKESLLAACRLDLEGIVGKKASSVYSGTRNGDWIKLKCAKRQEFVIGGYTRTDKKPGGISSLLLGAYEGEQLIYTGRAGTGLSGQTVKELLRKFEAMEQNTPPFSQPPVAKPNESLTWLAPALAAEIKFAEWTDDRLLRQASFQGLREDKDPRDIQLEGVNTAMPDEESAMEGTPAESSRQPGRTGDALLIGGIKITSPDKVLFEDPVVTKADVVRYYEKVSERMLPYVGSRILSIVRCPKGIGAACFFKKHPGPDSRGVVPLPIQNGDGEQEEYFYLDGAAGLLSEAQMGTLEFHIWGSRAGDPEQPDLMVFDLDPDEGMEPDRVRQGIRDLRGLLDQLSLTSFLKTSAGKGYHVTVPFEPSADWEAFHDFARRIAEVMEKKWPDRYTANVRKEKRKNKIFIDWMRNGRGATSIAPYSLRARKGAPVSMPIAWEGFFRIRQRLKL